MSLMITLTYKDQYVIAAGDSCVTKTTGYDLGPGSKHEETNLSVDKTIRLTDNVLLCDTGWGAPGRLIKREIKKLVKPEYQLEQCYEILKDLILKVQKNLREPNKYKMNNTNFSLLGFKENGITGFARSCESPFEVLESPMEKGYYIALDSPNSKDDRETFYPALNLHIEHQTIDKFIEQIIMIHSHISFLHKGRVSTDCNIHIIYKKDVENTLEYLNLYVDTEDILKQLKNETK